MKGVCIYCEENQAEGLATFENKHTGAREAQSRCFDCRRSCNRYWSFVLWQGFTAEADALHIEPIGWVP
jgi:hypothetical protein